MLEFKQTKEMFAEIALYRSKIDEIRKRRIKLECEIKQLESEYNESLAINRLLAAVSQSVFKWMTPNDLLLCEQVCQAWAAHVAALHFEKLVIAKRLRHHPKINRTSKIRPRKWFFSGEDEQCFPSSPMLLANCKVQLRNSFMLRLRQLKICDKSLRLFDEKKLDQPLLIDAKFVNNFVNLEVLEISRVEFDLDNTLRLPELKYLAIGQAMSNTVIDCPKLSHYRHKADNYQGSVRFAHPESVTHLYAITVKREYETFKNLQYMCLISTGFHGEGSYAKYQAIDFLGSYRALKQLSLRPAQQQDYKNNRGSFLQLLKQKRIFKRDDLTLIFYGIRLENAAQLENRNEDVCSMLSKLYIRNCTKLCENELLWIRSLNYTAMMKAAMQRPIKIPLDVHRKLFNVRQMVLCGPPNDEEHFFRFVAGFKRLVTFRFEEKLPSEQFFERLAVQCASNWYVELEFVFDSEKKVEEEEEEEEQNDSAKNDEEQEGDPGKQDKEPGSPDKQDEEQNDFAKLDFILKFINLASLKANRDFENAFIKQLFDRFDTFELHFRIKSSTSVEIVRKSRRSAYEYICKTNEYTSRANECKQFDSLDDLLDEIDKKFERNDSNKTPKEEKSTSKSDEKESSQDENKSSQDEKWSHDSDHWDFGTGYYGEEKSEENKKNEGKNREADGQGIEAEDIEKQDTSKKITRRTDKGEQKI